MAKYVLSEYRKKKKAEKRKAKRAERKRNHECAQCGKQDERTLSGRVYCEKCRAQHSKSRHKYAQSEHGKLSIKLSQRDYLASFKERGICIGCRKNKAESGHAYCTSCIEAYTKRNHDYFAKKKKEKEKCST